MRYTISGRVTATYWVPAITAHIEIFGQAPALVAADAGFYSQDNITEATAAGVKQVSVPNKGGRDPSVKKKQRQRWFKRGQRWRAGSEGRISVLKRRHGMGRSRYRNLMAPSVGSAWR